MVNPGYPDELFAAGIEGRAVITVTVLVDGTVDDCVVKSTDHDLFAEAALVAAKRWMFSPHLVNGQPVNQKVNIPFEFKLPGGLKSAIKLNHINRPFGRQVFKPFKPDIPIIRFRDLTPRMRPRALNLGVPAYPPELLGTGIRGTAVVKFFVDLDGQVINPQIIRADEPEFGIPAFFSVINSEFKPVPDRGQPIYVQAQRVIEFSEDMNSRSRRGARRHRNLEE
jgi:TonB family protein